MKGLIGPLLALLLLALPLAAQDASPQIVARTRADPATGAVIGQHVALYVDVMFPGEMPRPPQVTLPDVPGLQAFRFETQGTTLRETIAGTPYVGQRFEFALYARRGGDFTIPSPAIALFDHSGEPTGTAKGEPVRLNVTVPSGVDPSAPVVATRHLALDEQWSPAPGGTFKAGDAIVRTITRTAEDVPGFVLRDLPPGAPNGVRTYVAAPDAQDSMNRGVVTGRRVDRITYVFERGGRFELPTVTQPWWDLGSGMLKNATGAGATISVAAAPATSQGESSSPMRRLTLAAIFAAVCLLLWLGARWAAHVRARRRADITSERKAFDDVRRAADGAEPRHLYARLRTWLNLLPPADGRSALAAAAPLQAALFGAPPGPWTSADAHALVRELASLRSQRPPVSNGAALPPLNPLWQPPAS